MSYNNDSLGCYIPAIPNYLFSLSVHSDCFLNLAINCPTPRVTLKFAPSSEKERFPFRIY